MVGKTREIAGPVLPGAPFGFRLGGWAQLRAFDTLMVWCREGPDRKEKFFIQSLLRRGLAAVRGGFAAAVGDGCNGRAG